MKYLNTKAIKRIFSPQSYVKKSEVTSSFMLDTGNAFVSSTANTVVVMTLRKAVFAFVSLIFMQLIQESVFNDLRFFGVKPNLALVVLIGVSLSSDTSFAIFYGLMSGLFIDIVYGRYLGFYALLFMYFALVSAAVVPKKSKGKNAYYIVVAPFIISICYLIESFATRFLFAYTTGTKVLFSNFTGHLVYRVLPSVLYDYLLLLVIVVPITFLWTKLGIKHHHEVRLFTGGNTNG